MPTRHEQEQKNEKNVESILFVPLPQSVKDFVIAQNGSSGWQLQSFDNIMHYLGAELDEYYDALATAEHDLPEVSGTIVEGKAFDKAHFHVASEIGDVLYVAIRLEAAIRKEPALLEHVPPQYFRQIMEVLQTARDLSFVPEICVKEKVYRNMEKYDRLYKNTVPERHNAIAEECRLDWEMHGGDMAYENRRAYRSDVTFDVEPPEVPLTPLEEIQIAMNSQRDRFPYAPASVLGAVSPQTVLRYLILQPEQVG
jgi:NTP pyrophosphatase (non-canonical NTP hydrolase)